MNVYSLRQIKDGTGFDRGAVFLELPEGVSPSVMMDDHKFMDSLHELFRADQPISGADLVAWICEHLERTGREMTPVKPEPIAFDWADIENVIDTYESLVRTNGPDHLMRVAMEQEANSAYGVFGEVVDVAAELGYVVDRDEANGFLNALSEATEDLKHKLWAEIEEKLR